MLAQNRVVRTLLERAPQLQLPNWYLGAGCIAQTIWNVLCDFPPEQHIRDYDLVYFDDSDLSEQAEADVYRRLRVLTGDLRIQGDVKNQARVHLWYEAHFGYPIRPYRSVEEAIASWPTTATAVGIRSLEPDGALYAPFGLGDLLAMVVRPNKRQITEAVYLDKVRRWTTRWPRLTVVAW